jgi:hypothetical protein
LQEGNWWTPSNVSPADLDAKVSEIRKRQSISEENALYKVEKLERDKQKALADAAKKAEREAEMKARQAKYAIRR